MACAPSINYLTVNISNLNIKFMHLLVCFTELMATKLQANEVAGLVVLVSQLHIAAVLLPLFLVAAFNATSMNTFFLFIWK